MNIDPDRFWNLFSTSHLVPRHRIESIIQETQSKLEKDKGQQADASQIAKSLIKDRVITKYQAEILLSGRDGPFRFGDYLIVDQFEAGPLSGSFLGQHLPTRHPVVVEFVGGDDEKALKIWKSRQQIFDSLSSIESSNLARVYETVVLPEYRLIVSQKISGSSLAEKLPRKARLPWSDACRILAQVAQGLSQLHQADQVHSEISPRVIWLPKKGPALLRMPILPDTDFSPESVVQSGAQKAECRLDYGAPELVDHPKPTFASDIYSLGCCLHRLIRGLSPFAEYEIKVRGKAHQRKSPPNLDKYDLPKKLIDLLNAMLDKAPENRPPASDVATQLAQLSGAPEKVLAQPRGRLKTESTFLSAIAAKTPMIGLSPQSVPEPAIPKIQIPDATPTRPPIDPSFSPTESTISQTPLRKKSNSSLLILAGTFAAMAALIGGGVWWAMKTEFRKPQVVIKNPETSDEVEPDKDAKTTDDTPQGRLVQVFVEDDGRELWETPTSGLPVDFSYLPTGVQIAMAIRPSELLAHPEGTRVLKGLGPQVENSTQWLQTTTGLELPEIEQLLVGFCSVDQVRFAPCYVVKLAEAIPREQLIKLWRPAVTAQDETSGVYRNASGLGFFVIADTDMATGFAMGPVEQMNQVSELAGANPLPSNLNSLAVRTDSERHFNLLFVKNSLFNDEGQALLSGSLASLRNYLRGHLPENLRSGLVSFHLDNGLYLETYVDHLPEIKPAEMAESIDGFLSEARDKVAANMANATPNPYWDQIRSRYAIMINEVYRNLRVGVEGPDVLANCWLPEIAAHNLATGSELALSFSGRTSGPPVISRKVPSTLAELLATPRDLSVTTNPDLGLLLAGIKTSIMDDYGELPFEFDIKLMGNDLLKDGITQNQRPGDFELRQKTLAEILTEIMYRANPDKDATGPNDPACKLVWVVSEEPPGSGNPIVLITTRDAVATKGYELPSAFQTSN